MQEYISCIVEISNTRLCKILFCTNACVVNIGQHYATVMAKVI